MIRATRKPCATSARDARLLVACAPVCARASASSAGRCVRSQSRAAPRLRRQMFIPQAERGCTTQTLGAPHTPHGQHGPVRTLCTRTRRRTHRGHWSAGGRAGRRAEMRIMDGAYRLDYFAKRRHNSHGYLQNGRRRAHATDSRGRARVRRRAHHSGDASAACALLANAPRAKREIQTATIRHRFAHAGKTADTSCLRHLQSTISSQKLSNTMPAANVTWVATQSTNNLNNYHYYLNNTLIDLLITHNSNFRHYWLPIADDSRWQIL